MLKITNIELVQDEAKYTDNLVKEFCTEAQTVCRELNEYIERGDTDYDVVALMGCIIRRYGDIITHLAEDELERTK